jgi:hypothetical protein
MTSGQELDPRFERTLERERRLNPPPAPIPLSPDDGALIRPPNRENGSVTFRWRSGDPIRGTDRYRICVFKKGQSCDDPKSVAYTIPGDRHELTPNPGLPADRFRGRTLEWTVSACRDSLRATGDSGSVERCATSEPRTLYWELPPPVLRSGRKDGLTDTPGVPRYVFEWEAVERAGVYAIALYRRLPDEIGFQREIFTGPWIKHVSGTSVTIGDDLPFRGEDVHWTVAACTHLVLDPGITGPLPDDRRCTIQYRSGTIHIENELVPPAFTRSSFDEATPISWTLANPDDIEYLELCAVPRTSTNLFHGTCEQNNMASVPVRPRPLIRSCKLFPPYPITLPGTLPGFDFRVSACNKRDNCWHSEFAPVLTAGSAIAPSGATVYCFPP